MTVPGAERRRLCYTLTSDTATGVRSHSRLGARTDPPPAAHPSPWSPRHRVLGRARQRGWRQGWAPQPPSHWQRTTRPCGPDIPAQQPPRTLQLLAGATRLRGRLGPRRAVRQDFNLGKASPHVLTCDALDRITGTDI